MLEKPPTKKNTGMTWSTHAAEAGPERPAAGVQVVVEHGVEPPTRLPGQALAAGVRVAQQVVAVVVGLAHLLEPERRGAARRRARPGRLGEAHGPVGHPQ